MIDLYDNAVKHLGTASTMQELTDAISSGKVETPYVFVVGNDVVYGDIEPTPEYPDYLEFFHITSLEDNNTIQLKTDANDRFDIYYTSAYTDYDPIERTGSTLSDWDYSYTGISFTLNSGETMYIAGNYGILTQNSGSTRRVKFSSTGEFEARGNLQTLIYGGFFYTFVVNTDDREEGYYHMTGGTYPEFNVVPANCFASLFSGSKIKDAGNLAMPATTINNMGYMSMFLGCTALTSMPDLSAMSVHTGNTIGNQCSNMFADCTSLTEVHGSLQVASLKNSSYRAMFSGCTSLTETPIIYYNTIVSTASGNSNGALANMFSGCTNLNKITNIADGTDCFKTGYTYGWCYGFGITGGTFVKASTVDVVTSTSSSSAWMRVGVNRNTVTYKSGIPYYWTVVDYTG